MTDLTVGIDLGGTKVFVVVVNSDGDVIARSKATTKVGAGVRGIGRQMKDAGTKALRKAGAGWDDVSRAGLAVPSSVDSDAGVVLHAPALGWRDEQIKAPLEKIFGRALTIANDVDCGTWAEFRAGAGHGCSSVAGYFVGTGLGGGLVVDGRLLRGKRGVAGEFGHEVIRYKGRPCGCGKRGCLEAYCSKTAFCREFDRLINRRGEKSILTDLMGSDFSKGIRSKVLAKAYRKGDDVTHSVVHKGMRMLGVASANMMAIAGPDCLVYGGGVMEALGKELLPTVEDSIKEHLFALAPGDVTLRLSMLEDDAVALGAALLAAAEG